MIARRKLANIYAVAAMKKALKHSVPGHMTTTIQRSIFFHPDYTVGSGISPNQPCWTCAEQGSRTVTAGQGISPCPEDLFYFALSNYSEYSATVNTYRTLTRVTPESTLKMTNDRVV